MTVWALVPLKALDNAKRRLAPALEPADRRRLARVMCRDVLDAVASAQGLSGVALVTSERDLAPSGVRRIDDRGDGLNAALADAAAVLEAEGATAVLTIAADVPLATRDDIEAILAAGRQAPVVIVPDRRRRGTNALMLSPPRLLRPAFGEASLARHIALARSRGIEPAVLGLAGPGFDVDDAGALEELRRATAGRPAYGFLRPALEAVS